MDWRAVRRRTGGPVPVIGFDLIEILPEGRCLTRSIQQDADFTDARLPAIAVKPGRTPSVLFGEIIARSRDGRRNDLSIRVERHARAKIDRSAQRTLDHLCRGILVDIDPGQQVRTDLVKRQADAAVGREDIMPVQFGTDVAQPADRDDAAIPEISLYLYSGDALQRFGHIDIRESADILGSDRIDDLTGVLLDRLRRGQALAEPGDNDIGLRCAGGAIRALRPGGIRCGKSYPLKSIGSP